MFIIEYFDRSTHRWRPMPADAWTADQPAEFAAAENAQQALARHQRRSPSCPMRVTATVPA